jgi:hypothetical protein
MGDDTSLSIPIPRSLPFPLSFPGVLVLVLVLLPTLPPLKSSNLCSNNSNPTSPILDALALDPSPAAELSGVGADRDGLHGLFLGRDESELGRDEHIERGFWVGVGGASSTNPLALLPCQQVDGIYHVQWPFGQPS